MKQEFTDQIKYSIKTNVGGDPVSVQNIVDDVCRLVAETIRELDVPIDIRHWMGTKKHISRETALSIADWFESTK